MTYLGLLWAYGVLNVVVAIAYLWYQYQDSKTN